MTKKKKINKVALDFSFDNHYFVIYFSLKGENKLAGFYRQKWQELEKRQKE